MTEELDPFAHDDAAYVMGALSPEERRAFEAHLAGCEHCAQSVAELSGVTALLDKVPLARVLAPAPHVEQPPDLLLPLLVRAARSERRRRSFRLVMSGAAAAGLLAGAVAVGVNGGGSPTPVGATVAMTALRPAAVEANLRTTPTPWGTRVTLDCHWVGATTGPDASLRRVYRLVAVPRDGSSPQVLAQWGVLPGDDAKITGSTDLATTGIATFQVRTVPGDAVLLQAPAGES